MNLVDTIFVRMHNTYMDNKERKMRVWVVLEGDRGCGPSVVGVFLSRAAAEACVADYGSSHVYVYSDEGEVVAE